jgi:hypothetical protein
MKVFLVNFAFLSGIIGFSFYLFLILASFVGCCTSITTLLFSKIAMGALAVAVLLFIVCMYHNCCKMRDR